MAHFYISVYTKKEDINILYAVAWLKSSLFIFSLLRENNNLDFVTQEKIYNIFTPNTYEKETSTLVCKIMSDIISLEEKFLNESEKIDVINDDKRYDDLVENHNFLVSNKWYEIDKIFYEIFCLNNDQISFITRSLHKDSIYVPTAYAPLKEVMDKCD